MEQFSGKLLQRLLHVQSTADSIGSLSHYCQSHEPGAVIPVWFDALRKCAPETLKPLFYLANDVIQRTRGNPHAFVAEFAKVLERGAGLAAARNPGVTDDLVRLFHLWQERQLYTPKFMETLTAAARNGAANPRTDVADAAQGVAEQPAERRGGAPDEEPTPAADGSAEDAIMGTIMAGSLQEALNEAQRRHRISLAVMQLLAAVKPAYKDGSFGVDALSADDAAAALREAQEAEKHARYALAIARMNVRRRPATIAKLSESLATESEKLQGTLANIETYQKLLESLETLNGAAAAGKTLRARLHSSLAVEDIGAIATDDYWSSFADLGDAAPLAEADAPRHEHGGIAGHSGEALGAFPPSAYPGMQDWSYGLGEPGFVGVGEKRARPAEFDAAYAPEYTYQQGQVAFAPEGVAQTGVAALPGLAPHGGPATAPLPASGAPAAARPKKKRPRTTVQELEPAASGAEAEEHAAEREGAAAEEAPDLSEPFDINSVLRGQVWNPVLGAFVSTAPTAGADDSWRDH